MTSTRNTRFRVLFISGADGGTRRYRCFQPQEQLELYDIPTGFCTSEALELLQDVLDYDVFIFHRVPHTRLIGDVIRFIQLQGKIAIFETDDLVFEPDLVEYDGYYRSLNPIQAQQYVQMVHQQMRTLQQCDYALTTTEYLARMLKKRGKRVFINRNALSADFVRQAEELGRRTMTGTKTNGDQVIVGYISGSKSHDHDFEVISDPLAHVLETYPQVTLRIVGPLNLGPRLARLRDRIELLPLIPWQDVPREIRAMDINLAPLEQDNPFCQCKSELKYFEAGILGVPVIATRTDAFAFAIRHGETGFLASSADEWIHYLTLLITDPARRRAVGEAAYHDVRENYTPATRGRQFSSLMHEIVSEHQPNLDLVLEPAQAARRVVARLGEMLAACTLPPDPLCTERLNQALTYVRRERTRPLHRLQVWIKHLAKTLLRRTYELTRHKKSYRLIGELTRGQVYCQAFQCTDPDLCSVDVLFATFDRLNTPDLVFRLKESPTAPMDLVTLTVSTAILHDNWFHGFSFDPLPNSEGKLYYFSIESPDAIRGDAVGLWELVSPLNPAAGQLYRNGAPIPGQLAFQVQHKPPDDLPSESQA